MEQYVEGHVANNGSVSKKGIRPLHDWVRTDGELDFHNKQWHLGWVQYHFPESGL